MITALPRIAIAVRDFEAAVRTFRATFGMPVVDVSASTAEALGAHVAMCVPHGGSNIEIMAPADPETPLAQSLLKFLDRRGEGLFALMLEAADPDSEAEELAARGLDVLPLMEGAGGRDVHPRSTHGVLIRVYPDDSFTQRPAHGPTDPGLSGIVRAIIAVDDAAQAADVYSRLGLATEPAAEDERRGILRATCSAPRGGRVELVSVTDPSRPFAAKIERFLSDRRQGLYALELQATDPDRLEARLRAAGLPVVRPTVEGSHLETQAFGTHLLIGRAP